MYTANKIETFRPAYRRGYESSQRHLIFCLLITALLCLTAASNTASAATHYLDAINGDDSAPGTEAQPWQTMNKVKTSAQPGDTVIILNGHPDTFSVSWPEGITYKAKGVTQFGITWTFDQNYTVGQFANGDYWVVGPVTITDITRPAGSAERDGSMINPIPSQQHAYDSRVATYTSNLNVANSLPLTVNPNESLVSAISGPLSRPVLKTAAVLTVLGDIPPGGSFRPPYAGNEKPIYSSINLRRDLLLSLEPVGSTPTLTSVESMFERPWIDHRLGWLGDYLHPYENMQNYGAGIALESGAGALRLLLNDPIDDKELLLIRYVQLGIDNFGLVKSGAYWGDVGGTIGVGRKIPILFAGLMLDNSEIKSVASNHDTRWVFQEDGQTFYLTQAERDGTYDPINCSGDPEYCYPGYYNSIPLGTPAWGERHYRWLTTSYAWFPGKIAYLGSTYKSTIGTALTVHLLGIKGLWNYDPFLDWMDRSWSEGVTGPWGSVFADNMWDTYRADYGPVWPETDSIPPLAPTNLDTANQTESAISLSWTAPAPASDGDLASMYRILQNGIFKGLATGTSFEDTGLNADTDYSYQIYSIDDAGNQSVSAATGTFSTSADTSPPVISNAQASNVTTSQATITWSTDEASTSQVEYGLDTSYGSATDLDTSLVTSHSVLLTGLASETLYHYHIRSKDASGNQSISQDNTFTTAVVTYSITASAGSGGTISPSGTTLVVSGGSQTYDITANTGYYIWDVLVDGSSVGAVSSHSFANVTANHTIAASFAIEITASAGSGGQISPSGATQVAVGGSQTYSITANTGYHISDVLVDSSSIGAISSYSFTNVTDNHTIAATFAIDTYTITASAGSGGTISPSGTTQVNSGSAQTYTITPNTGYHITDVLVDGSSVGAVTSYPFTDITADHTIAATFGEQDLTAPTVTNLSPQADSIQAPLNTLVILDITDSGDGVDANSVEIEVNGETVYSGNIAQYGSTYGQCHRIGTKANYRFIYHQWKQNFEFDQPVSITVNATDLKSNVMDEYSYSFRAEMRSFGENKRVDLGNLKKGRPVTVRDDSNDIWAAWHAGPIGGSRDIYIGKLLAEAKYFGDSINLTNDANDQCNPVIAVGSDDTLYVAWQDNRRGNWDIYVSTSNDWSAEIRVTDSNDNQINPAIVVDSTSPNNAYIVWEDDRNGNQDIYVATSSDGFSMKTPITSDTSDQIEPAIAADADNTIYVVWTDTRNSGKKDIYGASSNGSWINIPVVTEEDSQSSPAIATEADGPILHLVWVDDRTTDGDDDIFYDKTSGGLTPLTGSSIIDDDTGAGQISPVIITTGSTEGDDLKVFACWRDERNADADLYLAEISSDYSAKISSGNKANVFVGDDGTNTDQSEPAIGIDEDGHPYLVWTNEKTDICYAGSTFIESELASTNVSIMSEATVGTMRNAIQSIDDVSAEVPQGAYLCDVKVTISKIKNPQKFIFERSTGVYEFGPSGMEFIEPVTITIPYEVNGSENVSYKAYWYNSLTNTLSQQGITNVQTIVISSNLHALRFKTTHFSPFILGGAVLGGLLGGGGGGGGGCSMSPNSQDGIVELLLPYIGLAVAMVVLKLRDRRKRKAHNITKSEC